MTAVEPGNSDEPECGYLATPEELDAVRDLAQHHCPKADDHRAPKEREHPKDK
ncbi:hypothetical protein [Mycobacteroides abscessus]|uniref:hypothetical protein n=1 Tax=Mycobacteroides abscessus TaxID=36809 RepID=UPI0012FFEDC4|nr:hypothetical protein [Mycobacteroides abscessus]